MEIQGKITAILAERTGVSARGEWKSQEFVITTQEQYPRKICFQVFGADKIASFALQVGQTVNVGFDISAREYQGRYYNQLDAWKVDHLDAQQQQPAPPQQQSQQAGYQQPPTNVGYQQPPVNGCYQQPQQNGYGTQSNLPFP